METGVAVTRTTAGSDQTSLEEVYKEDETNVVASASDDSGNNDKKTEDADNK